MADGYEKLVKEIDRIVSSPYPTQLKGLRDIACGTSTRGEITKWALARPCQIQRLAECLLDGLRHWPYVLELITRLACERTIRDALLQQSPDLLHDLVEHAENAASTDSGYITASVTFLSDPLPETIATPSGAQALFLRLCDVAADDPSLASIRKVHGILKGTPLLLGLLSSSSLTRLEEQLFGIIRNVKGENQPLSLYCLAIMKMICSVSEDSFSLSHSQYDTQELLASTGLSSASKWTCDSIQQFFTGAKAQKTMQLVVLRAMWACTTSTGELFDDRMESLLLANEVVCAISPHLRETWRKANSLIVGKLQDKITAASLEPQLKYQGLCFLAQVSESSRVPATVIDSLRRIATKPDSLRVARLGATSAELGHILDAGVFDENTLNTFLQQATDFAALPGQDDWLETSACLTAVLQLVYERMAGDSKLSEGTMLALDVISCGQKLHRLLSLVDSADGDGDGWNRECGQQVRNVRCGLIDRLCKVFLRAALCSSHQSYAASQDTITLLLDLHASSSKLRNTCRHSNRAQNPAKSHIAFVGASPTPGQAPTEWRKALQTHVQGRAQFEADQLALVFAKACADLEARCADNEAPLNEERQRLNVLQSRHGDLQRELARVEAENSERHVRFNALEVERDQYLADIDAQREEIEGHERRIEELLLELQQAREAAEQSRRDARSEVDSAEMAHAAAAARKDEEVEELQERLERAQQTEASKTDEIKALAEERNGLQQSLHQCNGRLDEVHGLAAERQESIVRLQRDMDSSTTRMQELSSALDSARQDAAAQREAFERDLNDLKMRADTDLTSANGRHEERLAKMTRMYEENAETLRTQLSELRDEVDQAREQNRLDLQQYEADIGDKKKKIDRLSRKCSEKDQQIAEANSMRTNLMAAMGLGALQPQGQIALPRPRKSSGAHRTQQQEADSQDDPSPPTPFSGDDSQQANAADASFTSNASSGESRNGPTPKRPRPRRSIKTHSPAKPASRFSMGTRSGARASLAPQIDKSTTKTRQPLLGVSGNQHRLPARSSMKTPSKHGHDEEDMFDGSEIFAGTQGMRLAGMADLGAALDEETETGL